MTYCSESVWKGLNYFICDLALTLDINGCSLQVVFHSLSGMKDRQSFLTSSFLKHATMSHILYGKSIKFIILMLMRLTASIAQDLVTSAAVFVD